MDFEKVKEIIVDSLSCDESQVTMEANLKDDLEADSLDAVEVIMALEDKYDIEIRDKKKETEYRAEIPVINEYFETLKKKVINETMTKLLIFYKVEIEV